MTKVIINERLLEIAQKLITRVRVFKGISRRQGGIGFNSHLFYLLTAFRSCSPVATSRSLMIENE